MTVSSWLYKEYSEQSLNDSIKMWYTCKYYFWKIFNFSLKYFCNVSYMWTMKSLCFERISMVRVFINGIAFTSKNLIFVGCVCLI